MIKHVVMFKFLEEAEGRTKQENLEIIKRMLENLVGVVPTLKSATVKINSEKANQDNYDLVLISEYDDWEGLQAYNTHPEHVKVGQAIKNLRESRACVDFEY